MAFGESWALVAVAARENLLPKDPWRCSVGFSVWTIPLVVIGQLAVAVGSIANFGFPELLVVRSLLNVGVIDQVVLVRRDPHYAQELVGLGAELDEGYLVLNHRLLALHPQHLPDLLGGFEGQENH